MPVEDSLNESSLELPSVKDVIEQIVTHSEDLLSTDPSLKGILTTHLLTESDNAADVTAILQKLKDLATSRSSTGDTGVEDAD